MSPTSATSTTPYEPLARRLDPPEPQVGLLVRPGDVGGSAAFQTLLRDGALVPLWGDRAAPARVPVTSTLRAVAVRDLVPARTVLGGLAAAWVLCGTPPPGTLDVLYPPGMHRPPPVAGRLPRQANVLRSESVLVAGVLVTDPQRTALDVAGRVPAGTALPVLSALRRSGGLDVERALRSLELRFRWAGRPAARATLSRLLAAGPGPV
ncbi:hypothetical protein IF650_15520 [Cellulosimicrobium terreum]|nr:hypothetical protein [Cellulosimicrobium terreum]